MIEGHDIELYLNTIIEEGFYSSKDKLKFQMETLFGGIDIKNKSVLDVGGGFGLDSFYLAYRGAKKILCLEPEAEGSSSGATDRFHRLNELLECNNVDFKPVTIQALESEGEVFDVILLHNSINNLYETACINLLKESKSKAVFQEIFSKIYSLSNIGAKLIICDCSRNNFLRRGWGYLP